MKHTCHLVLVGLLSLFCIQQAQAGLSGRFITTFGGISSSDCPWVVSIARTNIQMSYRYHNDAGTGTLTTSPGWKAKAGWFVYIENNQRVWAYDGVSGLFLEVAKPKKLGPTCTSYGPRSFPCPVPEVVLVRLSPEARGAIKSDKR